MEMNRRVLLICLTAGNFLYQLMGDGNYETAIERSYFMGGALFIHYLFNRVVK